MNLTDRPIAITGASSGIGRAAALACARAGMPVTLSARREDRLAAVAEEIRAAGGRAAVVVADVAEDGSGERLIEGTLRAFGSVYAVFANAGYGYEAAHHETPPEDVRAIFETNVFGSLRAIDAALPHLREQRAGHVLVCSSCLALLPTPYYGAYSATKASQHHLASAMRTELRPLGVHVTTVHPVGTRTEFFDQSAARSSSDRLGQREGGRFLQPPERVARAIVRALERPRPEVWTSTAARLGMGLGALTPRLRDHVLRRVIVRRSRPRSGH